MKYVINAPSFWGYIKLFKGKKSIIQLIDDADFYKVHFGVKKRDIGPENTFFLGVKL